MRGVSDPTPFNRACPACGRASMRVAVWKARWGWCSTVVYHYPRNVLFNECYERTLADRAYGGDLWAPTEKWARRKAEKWLQRKDKEWALAEARERAVKGE